MNRKLLIGGGVLLIAAGVGGFFWLRNAPNPEKPEGMAAKTQGSPPKVAYVDAKEMTLRLADTNAEHYIKLTPVLAVRTKKADEVNDRIAIVRDCIVAVVTGRSSTELVTPQGENRLKRDVVTALKPDFDDAIVEIYFSGYLVE